MRDFTHCYENRAKIWKLLPIKKWKLLPSGYPSLAKLVVQGRSLGSPPPGPNSALRLRCPTRKTKIVMEEEKIEGDI